MQILGFESGKNLQDAYENFKSNNLQYNFDEIIAQEIAVMQFLYNIILPIIV